MKIQVNTDSSVEGDMRLETIVAEQLESKLKRFRNDISRIEVHIRDVNADKGGSDDKQCTIEVRLKGLKPTAVTHNARTVESALNGGIGKMRRALDSTLGKRNKHR